MLTQSVRRTSAVFALVAASAIASCSSNNTNGNDAAAIDGTGSIGSPITKNDGAVSADSGSTVVVNDGGTVANDATMSTSEGGVIDTDAALSTSDAGTTATCDPAFIGKGCTTPADCGGKGTCLFITATEGVCSCDCTPDDPSTGTNEDSCPDKTQQICGFMEDSQSGGIGTFCLKKCNPKLGSNDCPTGVSCHPNSTSNTGFVDVAACATAGCKADTDCPVNTGKSCSISKKDCPTGQTCTAILSGEDPGYCYAAGKCDTASGLCAPHNQGKAGAKVGDACKSDKDCGNNMACDYEIDLATFYKAGGQACQADEECCSYVCDGGKCAGGSCSVYTRNGYCSIKGCGFSKTLTAFACPAGSACNYSFTGGWCQKTCDLTKADSCRGNKKDFYGDYDCRAWNNLTIPTSTGTVAITNAPVCEEGTLTTCDFMNSISAGADCSSLGVDSDPATPGIENPTNMACRSIFDGSVTSDPQDAQGICQDDTAAGTQKRKP